MHVCIFHFRDDPKPRANRVQHDDMDTAQPPVEGTPASYPCKCSNCPQMDRPEEQVCCLEESLWQDLYNTGGKKH